MTLMHFFRVYRSLKSCTSLLENVRLRVPALLGTYCLVFVPLTITVLLLRAHMLQTRWVNISTYLQLEPFLLITFILIDLKLLILFVHNRNILCYVILVTSHLRLFVCLFVYFSEMCVFSPVLVCSLSLVSMLFFIHNAITCIYTVLSNWPCSC
jgi:hypothetical protein